MDESSISRYITDTFAGVDVVVASGGSSFFYDADRTVPPDRRFPFATLLTPGAEIGGTLKGEDKDAALPGVPIPGRRVALLPIDRASMAHARFCGDRGVS
jgi:hypothetical protein